MRNEIIINAELGETRVALIENNQFAELHIERGRDKSVVGNVVKGRVSRVLPGMQAAFVDIGLEKAAFLYVGDYFESVLETGETDGEPGSRGRPRNGGRGRSSRSAPPRIDTVLREGQEIVVQIAKEPIGTKGARITSSISIPGRHLVLTPWSRRVGVSRRIGSDKERRRLREIVERLRPQNLGFIIRTAGDGVREADLQADIRYLATVWAAIQQRHAEKSAPATLYSEHDLPLRVVRDLASHETKRIVTDDESVYTSIKSFVDRFVADPKPQIEHYDETLPIFTRFDLESQINANLERKVWLKSGGSLVIDKSEALTAIDVNTGRFVGKRDLEETVLKTNLEAVEEVVHQLRFRNLGGLIIIDLIDMESSSNREKVYRALQEALRADKARTNILKISELGLVEMTRKRTRENLVQTLCEPCGHCEGRGYILSRESVAFRVLREVRKHLPELKGRPVAITVNPHVAEELLSGSKAAVAEINEAIGREIEIRAKPGIHQERFELTVLEPGEPAALDLPWLRDFHPDAKNARSNAKGSRSDAKGDRPNAKDADPDSDSDDSSEAPAKRNGRSRRGRGGRGRSSSERLVAAGEVEPETAGSDSDEVSIDPEVDIEFSSDDRDEGDATKPLATASESQHDPVPVGNAPAGPDAIDRPIPEPAKLAAFDAESVPESPETAQPVDVEAESRIIPRSE
jgi:ribonuclease G